MPRYQPGGSGIPPTTAPSFRGANAKRKYEVIGIWAFRDAFAPARHHTWLYLLGRDNAPGGRRLEVNGDGQVLTLSFSRRQRRGPTGSRPLGTRRIRTALCIGLAKRCPLRYLGRSMFSGLVCPGCHASLTSALPPRSNPAGVPVFPGCQKYSLCRANRRCLCAV